MSTNRQKRESSSSSEMFENEEMERFVPREFIVAKKAVIQSAKLVANLNEIEVDLLKRQDDLEKELEDFRGAIDSLETRNLHITRKSKGKPQNNSQNDPSSSTSWSENKTLE